MSHHLASAIFDSTADAERAVAELRSAGVSDSAISVIARHDGKNSATDGNGDDVDGGGLIASTAAGAGVGTLLGIAALAIPGVGPLAAAGAIASSAIPGAALTGAAVGAVGGGLTKLLADHGVSDEDAGYYEDRIHQGGTFVSVDTSAAGLSHESADEILMRHGGHNASRARILTGTQSTASF
jgi:hypothetical protein